jgi:hypothetical protein
MYQMGRADAGMMSLPDSDYSSGMLLLEGETTCGGQDVLDT